MTDKDILVVDDDPMVLASCQRVLTEAGYHLALAKSAMEALEVLGRQCFRLLLVDIKMPEKDGLYLIDKARDSCPDIPVLVMSGYPTSDTVKNSLTAGARDFIPKPFTPEELLAPVRRILEGEEE